MKDLKTLVYEEADKLLIHATKEERSKLDFETLDSLSDRNNVYGQMTGHTYSDRSINLMKTCSKNNINRTYILRFKDSYIDPVEIKTEYSPIEIFSHINNSTPQERKELIDYLKQDL